MKNIKKNINKSQIKHRPHQMSLTQSTEKIRLVITCTEEEKRFVKTLAASKGKTISDYLLDEPRSKMPKKQRRSNIPNKTTARVLKDSDKGKNLIEPENLNDFWTSLGFDNHA
jgi:hypothetical protein